jgi:hypothetical protein
MKRRTYLERTLLAPGLMAVLGFLPLSLPPSLFAGGAQRAAQQETNQLKFQPDAKKAKEAYRRGLEEEEKGNWTDAFLEFSDAVNFEPNNRDYLLHREIARSHRVQEKMEQAERDAVSGRLVLAMAELREARALDPTNTLIRDRISELSALLPIPPEPRETETGVAAPVHLDFQPGKRTFEIHGDVKGAYEEIARQFGVEAAFDVDVVPRSVKLHVESLDFLQAMDLVGTLTGTFWRPLTHRLFFVSPDTPQKRKEYDASIVRTIRLPASVSPEQMTEILRVVRDISGITRTEMDTRTGTITMRGSPRAMSIATGLVDDLEKSPGEVILEIEVLQVDRSYARQLGILPPQSATVYSISPQQLAEAQQSASGLISVLEQIFGTPSSLSGLSSTQIASLLSSGQIGAGTLIPPLVAFGGGMTTFLATLPGASADFSMMLSVVRSGQRIELRAEDGKPATFFVGDRIPVSLGQYSASLGGVGTSVSSTTGQSFPTTTLATGKGPEFITVADLRDQSQSDLIVANSSDNTLSVFLSNGDGTFEKPITPAPVTGTDPVWIATGDFNSSSTAANGDTFPDLAVADQSGNTVSILLGNGDGTFKPKVDLPTGNSPDSVVAANFHDKINSNLDLAVANFKDNTLSLYPGNGDGTFGTPTTLVTGAGPSALTTGDFNGDGHTDIAVTNKSANTVSVFLGNGDGTFQKRADYATGRVPVWVSTADLRGIGILDLVVANNLDNTVSILLGNGNGSFGAQTTFAAGDAPTSIAIADYNIDGILDLAVSDANDNAISLLLGLGDGTFSTNVELAVGTDPVSIVTADFNGDGRPDAAVANFGSNTATVILNSSTFSGVSAGLPGTPFPGVEYIDVGLKVKATPHLHPDNEVSLELNLEDSSVAGSSFNGIPVIASQSVEQTVRVRADQPSLLAAFLEPQYSTDVNGTPGLASVPVAGDVLSNTNTQNQDSELMVLLTPHIVSETPRSDRSIYAGRGGVEGRAGGLGTSRGFGQPINENGPIRSLRQEPQFPTEAPPPAGNVPVPEQNQPPPGQSQQPEPPQPQPEQQQPQAPQTESARPE